jgi:hypothetical protein
MKQFHLYPDGGADPNPGLAGYGAIMLLCRLDTDSLRRERPGSFDYTVNYGGGIGPDVWDASMQVSAIDIRDALAQAAGRVEEAGGWIYSIEQNE